MSDLAYLKTVAAADVAHLEEKERTYQGSWKRRGGVGAFMMLARKWDRLEGMLARGLLFNRSRVGKDNIQAAPYDIFAFIEGGPSGDDGTVLAEVRDLRRYLLLVEAEMMARGVVPNSMAHPATVPVHAVGDSHPGRVLRNHINDYEYRQLAPEDQLRYRYDKAKADGGWTTDNA